MGLQVGSLCIVNGFDKPCVHLIAVVKSIAKDGHAEFVYLDASIKLGRASGPISKATRLEDFGVDFVTNLKTFHVQYFGDSIAQYPDGKTRQWQDEETASAVLKESAYGLINLSLLVHP